MIASAGQFHAKTADGFLGEMDTNGKLVVPGEKLVKSFNGLMDRRIIAEIGADEFAALTPEQRDEMVETLPLADRKMGALLVRRDAFDLADTIAPLTGEGVAKIVFGIGVLGMALGAITMLMLINGLVLCEMMNKPAMGWPQKIGSLMVSVGVVMPFIWEDAQMWLAIPTSMFAMVLLPIAYISFTMLMNQKKLLGDNLPKGGKRLVWNILMACAVAGTTFLCMWTLWGKYRWFGIAILVGFIILVQGVEIIRKKNKQA